MQKTFAIGMGILAAAMFMASEVCAATGDWPQYGFTAEGRRENTQETVLTRKTVPHLVQKWSASIDAYRWSAPAVANGIIYAVSNDDHLYALDAKTGAQVWNAATAGPTYSSPAVADGVVYIGSGGSQSGYVYAFDAETGALRWVTPVDGEVTSPVTVAKGLVYAGSGGGAFALSAKTGSVKWTTGVSIPITSAAPTVSEGIVYFGSVAAGLAAFDAKTGVSLWWQELYRNNFMSTPVTYKGSVFVSDGSAMWAFDAKTGQEHWTSLDLGALDADIAMTGNHIYAADETGLLQTYDAATGTLKSTHTDQHTYMASPAIANGVIYLNEAQGNPGTLTAYDTHTGKPLWQDQSTPGFGTPTISNGMLYVGNGNTFKAYGLP